MKRTIQTTFAAMTVLGALAAGSYLTAEAKKFEAIYDCTFRSGGAWEYMFETGTSGRDIEIYGRSYGSFTAGPSGIMHYSGLSECAAKELNQPKNKFSFNGLDFAEAMAGIPAYTNRGRTELYGSNSFRFVNPALIAWGAQYVIPDPKAKIDGKTMQEIYDVIFARFGRLMVESYLMLEVNYDPVGEEYAYMQEAMSAKEFNGLAYLNERYGRVLLTYTTELDYGGLEPALAIGFWLRRGIDGTKPGLWEGLKAGMMIYDKEWFEAQLKEAGK